MHITTITNDDIAGILTDNSLFTYAEANNLYCFLLEDNTWARKANATLGRLYKVKLAPCKSLIRAWNISCNEDASGSIPSMGCIMHCLVDLVALYSYCTDGTEPQEKKELDAIRIDSLADEPYTGDLLQNDCYMLETILHGKQSKTVISGIKSLMGKLEKLLLLYYGKELERIAKKHKGAVDLCMSPFAYSLMSLTNPN